MSVGATGAGPGGQYDRLVIAPGVGLSLGGPEGGELLLGPPGSAPGSMSLTDLRNRTWHLLREDGPDTGQPIPALGDFNVTVVTRDLNIALAQFISQTGIAPAISERMDTFPVFALLDYPTPPGLISIARIDYNPYGQQTYKLVGFGMQEWDNEVGLVLPNATGQPYYFRQPFAGYIRLQPQPGPGNASGPGVGTFTLTGTPSAGQQISATLKNGLLASVTTGSYTVTAQDSLSSVAVQLSNLILASTAASGPTAFLARPAASVNQVNISALNAPGTGITYFATLTGTTMSVTPTVATALTPTGDTMTFYYSSLGTLLINPGDTPGIPPQFHMALVYRVLMDYWARKQDMVQSKHYFEMFALEVKRGKDYVFDLNRATQPTLAGDDYDASPLLGGW